MHSVFLPTRQSSPISPARQTVPASPTLPLVKPATEWPLLIKWIARHRQKGDIGAGDTLERLLAKVGADRAAKAWERMAGRPCKCVDRKAWMNGRYPYEGLNGPLF